MISIEMTDAEEKKLCKNSNGEKKLMFEWICLCSAEQHYTG